MNVRAGVLAVCGILAMVDVSMAIPLGTDITIYDGSGSQISEDEEVEPNNLTGRIWDLEGFFLDGCTLTMVGGYNFESGQHSITTGDIFIDIDGNVQTSGGGYGNTVVQNNFGYEYVVDLDFSDMTYQVYQLDTSSRVENVFYKQNQASNPWRYHDSGVLVANGSIGYWAHLPDSEVNGFLGGTHYAAAVDLSFLAAGTAFYAHYTYGCGNDSLMGQGTSPPVPEPATVLLLGAGLVGVAAIGRRRVLGS